MKKHIHYLLFILLSLCLFACSSNELYENERIEDSDEIKKVTIIMPQLDIDESHSRTAFTMGEWPNIKLEWAEKDTLGIYPNEGDQLSFPIVGSGTSCTFNGGGWALKSSYSYTAYFPFNRAYYYEDKKSLPITMLGQKQTGNNNSKHLSAYDILIAIGEKPESGSLTFTPERKCAFARMDLVAPCAATWKSITLKSNAAFTTKAIMDLSLVIPTITATAQSNSVTLDLENVQTTADNLNIIAYMMFLPVDFTGKTLSIELKDSDDNIYTSNAVITNNKTNFAANGARWISAVFEKKSDTNEIPYVTFSAENRQSLTIPNSIETLEYSVGSGNWETLGTNTVWFGDDLGNLRLRGKNINGTAYEYEINFDNTRKAIKFGNVTPVSCSGDIRTLLDYENYTTVSTQRARFACLFYNCTQLISSPSLPAKDLATNCYSRMFSGCTSLAEAPELPAITLAEACYSSMFSGCTSLTEAPVLPATTLAEACYSYMFSGCTSLTEAPVLPATTLAELCYFEMFYGCTSITKAPVLPATTLANVCYCGMFCGCTSITEAPILPATTLAESCYSSMFSRCTSLTEAPVLPATTLAKSCYASMFAGTSLTKAPILPATTLAEACYLSMFGDCTSLINVPDLSATVLAEACYSYMFSGCTSITEAPALPATILTQDCYKGMFSDCTSLIVAPDLPATILANWCYHSMFEGCTSLTKAPALPATNLANYCYAGMFANCTKLTETPILPATILVTGCYSREGYLYGGMFEGCTNLNKVTMLATNIDAGACLWNWLKDVSSTGTFIKAKEMTSLPEGASGIPTGWTVVDYAGE